MITQETVDKVNNLSVVEVAVDLGVNLKKDGKDYAACCPFHNEKTPSFKINEAKNLYKCFGCGESGVGAISLVSKVRGSNFFESVKFLCERFNITLVTDKEQTPEQEAAYKKKESLYVAVEYAHKFYKESLESNIRAQDALKARKYDIDFCKEYGIGATSNEVTLTAWAKRAGVSLENLADAGIVKRREDGTFIDRFWYRLMFPIRDKYGRVVSFTGRDISTDNDDKTPKYLNGEESLIFKKNDCLLFYSEARVAIKSKDEVAISEGPFDVLRLHKEGLLNAVGTLGVNLSEKQIALLKGTANALLIGDTDKAGIKSVISQGKELTKNGFTVKVLPLIYTDENIDEERQQYHNYSLGKRDPDDFFCYHPLKNSLINSIENFVEFLAEVTKAAGGLEEDILDQVAPCLINLPASRLELAINRLKIYVSSVKAWKSRIDELKGGHKTSVKIQLNKKDIDIFDKYGFYENDNKYIFKMKDSHVEASNFVLRPLFHIQGLNSKRMFEMINTSGLRRVIELPQKDLISLQAFNLAVESMGNFLFRGREQELQKLKVFLYETTDSCTEITQLGWQRDGFWAFSNGVQYKGEFIDVDNLGIVTVGSEKYYLPAYSDIFKEQYKLYVFERQFTHKPGRIDFFDLAQLYGDVYGENGIVGLMFYLSTLYRDIVFNYAKAFPLIFLFGAKATGKTAMAISLLQFFGELGGGPNINSTTKAALSDHLATTSNSIQHVEEYRNDIEVEKREILKGAWDGTGRSRMNMDKDKKKETTHVDCSVMISGQQMPTADEALFTRVLFLCFTKDTFTDNEAKSFSRLRDIEASGLTHITVSLMDHREKVKSQFQQVYKRVMDDMNKRTEGNPVQERLIKNWATIQAVYYIIHKYVNLPWTPEQTFETIMRFMLRQSSDVSKGNEVGTFWLSVEFMLAEKQIEKDVDFVIISILPGSKKANEFGLTIDKPMDVIIIQHTRVFPKYAQFGKSTGENTQKRDTIEYYLKNSPEFLGHVKSQRFNFIDNDGNTKSVVRTGIAFDYSMLKNNFDISLNVEDNYIDNQEVEVSNTTNSSDRQQDLPF